MFVSMNAAQKTDSSCCSTAPLATKKTSKVDSKIETKKVVISKDMTIGDVVGKYPELAPVITANGLHCVGCHVSQWETLEEGFLGHGMSEEDVDRVVAELNDFLAHQAEHPIDDQTVVITDAAVEKIKALMKGEAKVGHALRVAVVSGGCSGMSYELSFVPKENTGDIAMEKNGLKIFLDPESVEFMGGATIDFIDTLQESGFKIHNPKAKSGCGCGKSFG